MLVLSPESGCDVCAETYNQESLPHAIPCGHTFCAPCLGKISKGLWSPRVGAACPLCRETFSSDSILRIRIDQSLSSSPPYPHVLPYPNYFPAQQPGSKFGAVPLDEEALDDNAAEEDKAKRLEAKVKEVARRKCTFEELSSLQREIDAWLTRQRASRPGREYPALSIARDLLSAILVNGFRSSEAMKAASSNESVLKEKLDAAALDRRRMEVEMHRMKLEMSKLAGTPLPPPLAAPTPPVPVPRPLGLALGSGLRTPSSAVPLAMRSQTPGPTPTQRAMTPGPMRSQTPAALGHSAYPRANATTSHLPVSPERGGGGHQRWIPTTSPEDDRDVSARGRAPEARPGTAYGHHARTFSLGAGLASGGVGARPQTAAGWRR
ncbi:hypothetical protein EXIGLDRAFT_730099 [Exidia glandulosa HHB12029]|uniref:RING-type domain-containing protein n=1 Tax=Exidia glandulosa HHB12029 TaxID=1314781 RepID=A0A165LDG5_EXIGL|nr:hypothetical protein EXIGLDRAFT_730099 [Exidia glandulosa HHB12029]